LPITTVTCHSDDLDEADEARPGPRDRYQPRTASPVTLASCTNKPRGIIR
jgi:hypothetical protein